MGVSYSDRLCLSTAFEKSIRKLAMPALPYKMAGYAERKRFGVQGVRAAPAPIGTLKNLGRHRAGLFADETPGALDVPRFGGGLADAEAERELVVQFRVREVEVAALIEAFHDGLIDSVAGAMAKADKIQRHWRGEFKLTIVLAIVAHPGCELLRKFDMAANVILQAFDSIVTNHKPEF